MYCTALHAPSRLKAALLSFSVKDFAGGCKKVGRKQQNCQRERESERNGDRQRGLFRMQRNALKNKHTDSSVEQNGTERTQHDKYSTAQHRRERNALHGIARNTRPVEIVFANA